MAERRKFSVYMHPDEDIDQRALDVIESVSQRIRGDFLRNSVIAGCALYQIDKRLPGLLAALFNGDFNDEQLVALLRQTTGWKPSEAEIIEVIKLSTSEQSVIEIVKKEGVNETSVARKNMTALFDHKTG